jgi:hypothetical protein
MKYSHFFLASILVLTGCVADSRTQAGNNTGTSDGSTNGNGGDSAESSDNVQESVIPSTGGRALSADGKFAVVVGPLVFDSTVTMVIEQTEVSAEDDPAAVTPHYTVTYTPEDVQAYSNSTVRVEFTIDTELLDSVGAEMFALWHMVPEAEGFDLGSLNVIDDTFPKLWASVSDFGTFGLVDLALTDACPCDADLECDTTCICDPDCGDTVDPTDESDATDPGELADPSDPTDGSATSDASDPSDSTITCTSEEFACTDGTQCIPTASFCDGLPQCNDGSDETDPACTGGGGDPGGGGSTLGDDEYEPDDSYGEATVFEIGSSQTHSITSGDEDFILFTLDGPYDVVIETSGAGGDTKLWLYTENYTELGYNDDGGYSVFSKIEMPLQAGNYYAKATGYSATTEIASYNLTVTATPPLAEAPTNLVVALEGDSVVLTWDASPGAASYNVYYGDYSGSYNPITAAAEGLPPLSSLEPTSTLTGLSTGSTYYFTVRAVGEGGLESYSATEVSVQIPLETDAYEPNNTFADAIPLVSGETINLSIHESADLDYWTFTLPVPASVHVETDGQSGDGQLYVYDSSQSQIYYNDDGGNGLFSMLDMELQPGVYYVLSQSYYNGNPIGAYTLNFSAEYQAPTIDAPDAFELDDSLETASVITAAETQERNFHREEDVDYISFTLDALSDFTISTDGVYGGTNLTLYDAEGVELAAVASGATAEFVSIEQIGMAPGAYTVKVESQNPTILISYELMLEVVAYPVAPENFRCSGVEGVINLVWNAVPGATSYNISYEYSDNPPLQTLEAVEGPSPLTTTEISYSLTGLPTEAETFFRVTAVAGEQESEFSEVVSCTPQ